jgi:hypothetical protein
MALCGQQLTDVRCLWQSSGSGSERKGVSAVRRAQERSPLALFGQQRQGGVSPCGIRWHPDPDAGEAQRQQASAQWQSARQ